MHTAVMLYNFICGSHSNATMTAKQSLCENQKPHFLSWPNFVQENWYIKFIMIKQIYYGQIAFQIAFHCAIWSNIQKVT